MDKKQSTLGGLGGFGGLGGSIDDTLSKMQEIVDLDKASASDIRRWTLAGIVNLQARIHHLEKLIEQQEKTLEKQEILRLTEQKRLEGLSLYNHRFLLLVGAIAWVAVIIGSVALVRTF